MARERERERGTSRGRDMLPEAGREMTEWTEGSSQRHTVIHRVPEKILLKDTETEKEPLKKKTARVRTHQS